MSGDERKRGERGVENGVKEEKMRDRSERKDRRGREGMRWREREAKIEAKTGRRRSRMLNEEEESCY